MHRGFHDRPRNQRSLKRLGLRSVNDIEKLEERNIDPQGATGGAVDFTRLANMIQQARRGKRPPRVRSASVTQTPQGPVMRVEGENLCISQGHVPVAVVNEALGHVLSLGPDAIEVLVPP